MPALHGIVRNLKRRKVVKRFMPKVKAGLLWVLSLGSKQGT
ncbi:hypothetical protein [Leptospira barantonii]|nr:hypothetical protein [Leptospira barantonii]